MEGHRQTFLSALHPAALGERMPVLTGEEFPTIRAWGRSFAQSPPGVRVLSWQHDGWAPVCGIEVAVEQGRDSCLFSLKGDGLRRVTTSGGYAVVRVELWDLSLHGRLLPPLYFLVFPGAKVETQVGLVPAREPGRLALSLSGPFVAHAGIGQVYMRRLGGRTQVVHQLPTGLRRGQLGLRSAMLPTADIIVLEWFSPGVPAATVAHAGAKQGQVPLCTQLPLPAIDLDDRTPWKGHESVLAWWPGLTASVIFGQEQRTLANISFARDATSRVYLGDVLSAATELVATDGQVEVSLRVGIYAWPLVCIRSQKRLAEMETERQRRRMPDSGELAHLLWACDLLMSGREATFPPIRADRSATALLQRLRELGEVSPAAKHMEARLRVWLLFHPDDLVFLDPGGRQR